MFQIYCYEQDASCGTGCLESPASASARKELRFYELSGQNLGGSGQTR